MLHSVLQWVKQLVSKGNKVIACCRNPSEAADLQKAGVAHVVKLDVSDPASIQVLSSQHTALMSTAANFLAACIKQSQVKLPPRCS